MFDISPWITALLPLLRPLMALMSSCTVMHEDVWVTSDPELPLTNTQELCKLRLCTWSDL